MKHTLFTLNLLCRCRRPRLTDAAPATIGCPAINTHKTPTTRVRIEFVSTSADPVRIA
jgi:hypothetical protein